MKINKVFTIILYGRVLVWLGNYYVTKLKENEGKFCDETIDRCEEASHSRQINLTTYFIQQMLFHMRFMFMEANSFVTRQA